MWLTAMMGEEWLMRLCNWLRTRNWRRVLATRAADAWNRNTSSVVWGTDCELCSENLLAANSDACISIPMHGTRSLNLATAVAIVLFEAMRQQR